MGEKYFYQPLTREDRISVVLYRSGIVLFSLIISIVAAYPLMQADYRSDPAIGMKFNIAVILLYVSVGVSVFFIHLYVSKFHRALKKLYYIAIAALIALFLAGNGDVLAAIAGKSYGPLLLIPLSGCIGFITAKEAFCFKLMEGYLIALVMPLYLLSLSLKGGALQGFSYGLFAIAAMLLFFTFRKVFMPMHYDIGDKSAYQ